MKSCYCSHDSPDRFVHLPKFSYASLFPHLPSPKTNRPTNHPLTKSTHYLFPFTPKMSKNPKEANPSYL